MMAMQKTGFNSLAEMMDYIRGLTVADKRKILRGYGYDVDSIDSTRKLELLADYIIQGLHRGIKGDKLVGYANNMTSGIIEMMPYFGQPDNVPSVAKSVNTAVVTNKPLPVAKKTKSLPVAKSTKSAKIKHPDFTIVFRADRNGYEGWYGGKAEAFRDNIEKVHSFFQKKYGQPGKLI